MQIPSWVMTIITAGAACIALASSALAASLPSFIKNQKLIACMDPGMPPMNFRSPAGEPIGFDTDLIEALAKHWDVKFEVQTMDFAGLLPALGSGRCDMLISAVLVTPERVKNFAAVPYLQSSMVYVGKADSPVKMGDEKGFSGKTVAVQAGTAYVEKVEKLNQALRAAGLPEVIVQTYPKSPDAFNQVLNGRALATLTQDTEVAYRDTQTPGVFKILFQLPYDSQFAIYFRHTPDEADLKVMKESMKELYAQGVVAKIADKWKIPKSALIQPEK